MTHDEYMRLDPRTKYQIEKERRANRPSKETEMTAEQLRESRTLFSLTLDDQASKTRRKKK